MLQVVGWQSDNKSIHYTRRCHGDTLLKRRADTFLVAVLIVQA